MEDIQILDSLNHIHLYCLHFIFRPRIQSALDIYMATWNHHPISDEKNSTPMQLFVIGTNNLLKGGKIADEMEQNLLRINPLSDFTLMRVDLYISALSFFIIIVLVQMCSVYCPLYNSLNSKMLFN